MPASPLEIVWIRLECRIQGFSRYQGCVSGGFARLVLFMASGKFCSAVRWMMPDNCKMRDPVVLRNATSYRGKYSGWC